MYSDAKLSIVKILFFVEETTMQLAGNRHLILPLRSPPVH
jgi:hypothetical protein